VRAHGLTCMSDTRDLGFQILAERSVWERKQRLYYQMRHDGLRRLNKPGPWAADQHLPIVDMNISDLKPFWSAQVFGGEKLCDFVAMRQQLQDMTESAADFHDFELRNFSNYRLAMETAIDTMLLRGRGVLLAITDPFEQHAIKFRAIDPLYILMGQDFNDFEDADEWIYVQALTVAQYKRNRNYNQSADVIGAIRGKRDFNFNSIELDKQVREGVTHSCRDNQIILWHHWKRTLGGFTVNTFSPQATDKEIRKPYGCPYKVAGKASQPFFSITMEVKDEGWYSPRGVAELNAAFEAYACTLWNHKTDAMKFGNTPLFTSDKEIPNSANIRFNPGEFIPGNIKAVEMPQPAFSFDQEINFSRGLSEQRARVPDFGISDDGQGGQSKPRTATENNRIASMQSVGADYNGEVFRSCRLQKIYRHTWGLMLQFKRQRMTYFVGDDLKELPAQAVHDEYLVVPTGGTANKLDKLNRAGTRFQLFKGAPNVNQDELVKDVLAADDSRMIRRLLIPSDTKQQDEAYQEALDIGVMMMGYPPPVKPQQDHATRIMVLVGFLHKQQVTGAPVDPMAVQRIQQHLAQHMQFLKQTQPEAFKQVMGQIQQMEAAGGPQPVDPSQAPGNVTPMPGAGAAQPGQPEPAMATQGAM
jgi:hypothetical protein